jgi:hypothetical protein
MSPKDQASVHAAVFRNTAKDPSWLGHWLARHQQSEDLDEKQLAEALGISMDNLVLLCLCRSPRADHYQEDLKVICDRTGVSEQRLAGILRQEQTLIRWTEKPPVHNQGWLMAASDRPKDQPDSLPNDAEQGHDK